MPVLRQSFSNAGSLVEDADRALHQLMVDRVKETFGNALPIDWTGRATDDLVQVFSSATAFFRLLHEQRSNAYVELPDWSTRHSPHERIYRGEFSMALCSDWQNYMDEDENGNEVKITRWELKDDPQAMGHHVDVSLFPGLYRYEESRFKYVSLLTSCTYVLLLTLGTGAYARPYRQGQGSRLHKASARACRRASSVRPRGRCGI